MVRILHIIGSLERAGAETFVVNLYRNIDRKKIQFDFAIYNTPTDNSYYQEVLSLGAKVFQVKSKSEGVFRNFNEVKSIVKAYKYNVVWRHTNNCFGGLDLFAAKCGGAKKLILHSHNTTVKGIEKILHYLIKPFINIIVTDKFSCGKAAGRWMFIGRRFEIINNGIDVEGYKFDRQIREEYRKEYKMQDKLVIGHVGRFEDQKNHFFLVRLFHEFLRGNPNALLVLIGKGEKEAEIKDYVLQNGLEEQVLFMGSRSDVSNLLQMMDIFVMPSLHEGFPVTLIEAQAAGLPCIVSDTVSCEVDITGNVQFVNLRESVDTWIEKICSIYTKNRKTGVESVKAAGYDIRDVAEWVENYISCNE